MDPFGLCKIQVGYTNVIGGSRHAFITMTRPDATSVVYRGGPSNTGSKASSQSSAKESSGDTNTNSSGAGFGPIDVIKAPQWSAADPDTKRAVSYDEPLVDDSRSCDSFEASFDRTRKRINDRGIPYRAMSQNSNSVVNTLLVRAGLKPLNTGAQLVAGGRNLLR